MTMFCIIILIPLLGVITVLFLWNRNLAKKQRFSEIQKHDLTEANRKLVEKQELFEEQKLEIAEANLKLLEQQELLEEQKIQIAEANLDLLEKNEIIQGEYERAGHMQRAMLPKTDLDQNNIEICGFCQPTEKVGGDYYDYQLLPDGRIALAVGDVMGHGLNAGLLMAVAKSCFINQVRTAFSVSEMMKAIDYSIANITIPHTESGKDKAVFYMTFFYAVIDTQNKTMSYCNAGHTPAYHCQKNKISKLESTNCPLGMASMLNMNDFQTHTVTLTPEDRLIVYSDAIIEERDGSGNPFGNEKLEKSIAKNIKKNTPDIRDGILKDFYSFVGEKNLSDDVTLVIAKIKK